MIQKFILFALVAVSCTTNPHSNRRQLTLIPQQRMFSLGKKSYEEMKKKETLLTSGRTFRQVVSVGKNVAKASGIQFPWEFAVIKNDKKINAFCLPGGKIAVYTGILAVAENEAGLAAILGHEIAHAVLRHGAERMSQALMTQLGLVVADISLENTKYKRMLLAAMGLGAQFGVLMPFSRSHESEADAIGLRYMAKAGYDPYEAPKLWQRMASRGRKNGVPEMLSTHPDPNRRARDLARRIPSVLADYGKSQKKKSLKLIY